MQIGNFSKLRNQWNARKVFVQIKGCHGDGENSILKFRAKKQNKINNRRIKQKKSMLKKKDKFLFADIIQYDVRIRNTNFLRE